MKALWNARSLFPTANNCCGVAGGPRSGRCTRLAAITCNLPASNPTSLLNEGSITGEPDSGYPHYKKAQVGALLNEAWECLRRDGLIASSPGMNRRNGWMSLTRAGDEASQSVDAFERVRAAKAFPKTLLHPSIADQVWSALMRGDLDEAVFKAFKAVEVGVRAAGGYATTDIGVTLMRKAFHVDTGPFDSVI